MLTADRLRFLFDYDPDTGRFTRRITVGGQRAGTSPAYVDDHGYIRFQVDGALYRAHRLAWLYVNGSFPKQDLDHRDGNRQNNRITNLRECCDSQNAQNAQSAARADNTHGYRGVSYQSQLGLWQARIMVNGKSKSCGLFATPEAAHAAYVEAKLRLHPFQSELRMKGRACAS